MSARAAAPRRGRTAGAHHLRGARQTGERRVRAREPAGGFETQVGFTSFISWSGLDIGRDRGSPVSHYDAPFTFTGKLRKVTVTLDDDQALDATSAAAAALARE